MHRATLYIELEEDRAMMRKKHSPQNHQPQRRNLGMNTTRRDSITTNITKKFTEVKEMRPTTLATRSHHHSTLGTSTTATTTRRTRNHIATSTNDMAIPQPNVDIYRNSSSRTIRKGKSKMKDQGERSYGKKKTRTTMLTTNNELTRITEHDKLVQTPICQSELMKTGLGQTLLLRPKEELI